MSSKPNFIIRGHHDFTDRSSPKKYSHHFMPRPQTINPSKNSYLEKGSSLDAFNQKRSTLHLDRTEIVFKRDKLLYESKFNNLSRNRSNEQQRKNVGNPFQSLQSQKQDIISDNLKMTISKYQNLMDSSNDVMKNIVKEEILSELILNDPIFKRINKDLVESLLLIGKIKIYEDEEMVTKTENMIGFVLYGKVKIFNKDYRTSIEKGETFGEHLLFNFNITYKVRCLEPTCVFWLPVKYYAILREQSIVNGLKNEFNHLEIALRLSYIKKKFKETLKKSHH